MRDLFASIPFTSKSIASRCDFREAMSARRYTVLIADRSSGVMRQVTVSLRPTLAVVVAVLALPVLMGLGAKWSARAEIDQLRSANSSLTVENGSYRAATGELTDADSVARRRHQRSRRARRRSIRRRRAAMQKLPAVVKARAAGGTSVQPNAGDDRASLTASLVVAGRHVRRAARSAAGPREPSALRAARRRAARGAGRGDAVDLAGARLADRHASAAAAIRSPASPASTRASTSPTDKGQPVFATADGTVESAAYTGDYGNLIVLKHGFGLTTRYGHLSAFAVKPGQRSSAATSSATSARPAARPARTSTTRSSPTAS